MKEKEYIQEKEYMQEETNNKIEEIDTEEIDIKENDTEEEIDTEEEEIIIFFDNDDIEEEEEDEVEKIYTAHDLTREIASYYRVALPLIFIMIFFTVILPLILSR